MHRVFLLLFASAHEWVSVQRKLLVKVRCEHCCLVWSRLCAVSMVDRKQARVQGPRSPPGLHAGMQVAGGKRDCESQRSAKRARLGESGVARTEQEVRTPASAEPLERWCRQQPVRAPLTNHLHVLPVQHQPVSQPMYPWRATPEQRSLALEAFLKGCAMSCMSW